MTGKPTQKSNIPAGRDILLTLSETLKSEGDHRSAELIRFVVENYLVREPVTRRAPYGRVRMNQTLRAAIAHDLEHTDMRQSEIAAKYGVNSGRVSEVNAELKHDN